MFTLPTSMITLPVPANPDECCVYEVKAQVSFENDIDSELRLTASDQIIPVSNATNSFVNTVCGTYVLNSGDSPIDIEVSVDIASTEFINASVCITKVGGFRGPTGPTGPTGLQGIPGTAVNTGATGPTGPIQDLSNVLSQGNESNSNNICMSDGDQILADTGGPNQIGYAFKGLANNGMYSTSTGTLGFSTVGEGNPRMIITSGGLVGINNTNPGGSRGSLNVRVDGAFRNSNDPFHIYMRENNSVGGFKMDDQGFLIATNQIGSPGFASLANNGVWSAVSDERVKTDITSAENILDNIDRIRIVNFNFAGIEDSSTQIGVIAQEIMEVYPCFVTGTENSLYSVSYSQMSSVAIGGVKELHQKVKEQEQTINRLTETINSLIERIAALEQR
jgi:hypothetical protein